MEDLSVMISALEIDQRVKELAEIINREYSQESLVDFMSLYEGAFTKCTVNGLLM